MPIYEYKREDGTKFEIFQNMDDEALEKCPDTGQPCKRIISGGITAPIKRGDNWADKKRRKEDWIKKNPGGTTLPKYRKKIKENSEKARAIKAGDMKPKDTKVD